VSGPGGTFEITDVPEGTYRVYAHAPGYMVSPADDEITVGRSEAGAGTRVMLRLGGTVRGIVYGADGEPLAKAQLSGDQKARYPHVIAHSSLRITTDEQGRYAAENLLPGRYEWELEGDDGARAEAVVELHEAELIAGLDFRFTLGSALTVAVTKPDGAADGEAQVQLYRENDTPYPAREGRAQAVDAQGRVRFEHLLDGAYWVTVSSPHGAARRAGPWTVAAGEPPPEMDVRLEEGATIRGRVVDERREPVREASVTGYRSTYDGAGPSMLSATRTTVTTDGDGRFVIPHAAAGRWRLRAEGTSHAEADASAEVADRGESAVHIAVHRTWSGTLGGRILGPDGIPAAETRVSLQLLASPAGREVGVEHVRTDGEGRFSVAVDEKIGRVKVFPAGLSPAAVEVLPSDTAMASLEVRLPPVSGMAGTVEADGGIIPPGGLFVLAGPPDGSVPLPEDPDDPWPPVGTGFARVMPGQSDWEILGLAPGTYEVFTYAPGLSASVPSPVMVAEGDIALAVVEAALPGGAITGRVLTADGAPLGGVDIHVTTSGGRLRSSSSRVKSDEQGRYRLEGLTPGAVTLRLHSVENRGFARPPDHTTLVMPGVTTENVDFTLLAGGE
jgi:protocatechuate 3,4-dioxygenase beta subunit